MTEGYRVGQVLYVIPAGKTSIIPVRVMERRTSETMGGTTVTHTLDATPESTQPFTLETFKGQVFPDLPSVRDSLVRSATQAIEAMIQRAREHATQTFGAQQDSGSEDASLLNFRVPDLEKLKKVVEDTSKELSEATGMIEIMGPDGKPKMARVKNLTT